MNLLFLLCQLSGVFVLYYLSTAIYLLYFHPLHTYRGPKLWIISRIPFTYYKLTGQLPFAIKKVHDEYDGIARIGSSTISYTIPEAWDKIYGFPEDGAKAFPKDLKERRGFPKGRAAPTPNM
jgi:hypothetical protein